MSRHGGFGPPRPERWDPERFSREREQVERSRPVAYAERDRYEERDRFESRLSPPSSGRRRESSADEFIYSRETERGPNRYEEKDRFVFEEKERYGPPARRPRAGPGRFYEEEFDAVDSSLSHGQMVPFERRRESIVAERNFTPPSRRAPPRPTFIRRQSSLDTFDRKPMPKYGDRLREPPEVIAIPTGARRRSPPRYVERDFEEIRIAEPDYYGDEEFRGYKEREVSTVRTRRDRGEVEIREQEEFEVEEEPEKDAPRRGKTRMPMRLVNKRAVIELGYPFEEEGDILVILKALSKERIDEVIKLSREMKVKGETIESRTTYVIEAPPAPPPEPEPEIVERRTTEIIINAPEGTTHQPLSEAPRSVREWDVLSSKSHKTEKRSPSPSAKSHRTTRRSPSPSAKSHRTARRSPSPSAKSHRTERRGSSPSAKSHKSLSTHHSRHRSVSSVSTHRNIDIIKEDMDDSATIRGPLELIVPERRKDERNFQAEIRALEAEKRALKLEREIEKERRRSGRYRDEELLVIERDRKPRDEIIIEARRPREEVIIEERRPRDELIIEERTPREVKVEKVKAPNPRLIKAMLGTLT